MTATISDIEQIDRASYATAIHIFEKLFRKQCSLKKDIDKKIIDDFRSIVKKQFDLKKELQNKRYDYEYRKIMLEECMFSAKKNNYFQYFS